ncbi:Aste57867_560 [Aphanomyces stellatus]|uniref:Aste57867_560 protein n=1 Tax=Aphanomyces stellatus TaxID=120398 RepID=A0A485K342_9STRA|nr:hypothetical protein As57867_000559 [Aphanomyces stellatus]VFT77785.1 Aste57867_560 [Aphanomyces stellatus]
MYTSLATMSHAAAWVGSSFVTVEEAKHHILVICIGLLQALNEIHERCHLSSLDVLQQAEQHLRNILQAQRYASKASSSSSPEHITLLSALLSACQWIQELAATAYHHIYAHMLCVPGLSHILVWLEAHLGSASDETPDGDDEGGKMPAASPPPADSMMAVVLSYTTKDLRVSSTLNHRIQRSMHYPIDIMAFDATVQLQPSAATHTLRGLFPAALKSPQSMPTSPTARMHWQSSLASLSQNILYQARDQLRAERAATLLGDAASPHDICIVKFNRHDCHAELSLSCGAHAATKVLPGLYRSVRATAAIPPHTPVYFEVSVDHRAVSCCIGLSPRSLPLNALVGTQKHTIGVYSKSGMILAHSLQIPVSGLACSSTSVASTYGLLVHRTSVTADVHVVQVLFSRFDDDAIVVSELCEVVVPASLDLFPTVTLDSMHHTILSRFAPADLLVSWTQWSQIAWQYPAIYTLDGTLWSSYDS